MVATNKCYLVPFIRRGEVLDIAVSCIYQLLRGRTIRLDLENICISFICAGVVQSSVVLCPDNLVYPLILRGLESHLVFTFYVAYIEHTSYGHCELFAIWRYCYCTWSLLIKAAGHFYIVVRYRNLWLGHLATLQIKIMNLVLDDKYHCRAIVADGRVLERVVERGKLLRCRTCRVLRNIGLLIELVGNIIEIAPLVHHRPAIFSLVRG